MRRRTTTIRARRSIRLGLAVATLAALLVTACGGGEEESSDEKASTTTESTTTESTSTTAAPRAEADRASKDLASAGTLQTADFGEGWSEYQTGGRWTPTEESCNFIEGGGPEDTLLDGAALNGPTVQLGELNGFVYSRAYAFPTEADAIAWVDIAKSDEWAECNRKGLEAAFYPDGEGTLSLDTRESDSLGEAGFEAFVRFVGRNSEGVTDAASFKRVYRIGRTVIVMSTEDRGVGEDNLGPWDDGMYDALDAAYDRLYDLG